MFRLRAALLFLIYFAVDASAFGAIITADLDFQPVGVAEFDLDGTITDFNLFFLEKNLAVQSVDFDDGTGDLYYAVGSTDQNADYGIWRRNASDGSFQHLWRGNFSIDLGADITASSKAGRIVATGPDTNPTGLLEFDLSGNFLRFNTFFGNQNLAEQSVDFDEGTGDLYLAVGSSDESANHGVWRQNASDGSFEHLWRGNFNLDRGSDITASSSAGKIVFADPDTNPTGFAELDLNGNLLAFNTFFGAQNLAEQSIDFDEATGDLYFATGSSDDSANHGIWRQNASDGSFEHLWSGNFRLDNGTDITAFSAPAAVPELALLSCGGFGLFVYRRRKQHAA